EHHAIPSASPLEVLRELVKANNLRQKDLVPEFGTESIVSEVLNGKRELNKDHIEKLSKRFNVSPAVFFKSGRIGTQRARKRGRSRSLPKPARRENYWVSRCTSAHFRKS